jgi:hypothetical protein
MDTSVLDAIQATTLYQQTPGILLGVLLAMTGVTLLAVGLGAVREVRSSLSALLGAAALVGAVLVRQMAPQTAFMALFGAGAFLVLLWPVLFVYAGIRAYRSAV